MRLPRPFISLPFRVDADVLAAEVAGLDPAAWRPHPEGAPGNTAVPLVARGGDPGDDGTAGRMLPTEHLAALPYVVRVLAALDAVIGRTRLMRVAEEAEVAPHVDANLYWWERLRVHVPVLTTPDVVFECGGERVHMAAGEVWVFDTWRPHRVVNPAKTARIHLVADTVGSRSLWQLVEHPDAALREIRADDESEASFVTEVVNCSVVMSPWELERHLDELSAELTSVDPDGAARLREVMGPFRQEWRSTWAVHGETSTGWARYDALRNGVDRGLEDAMGSAWLPNGLAVSDAVRQLVLRPALNPPDGARLPTTVGSALARPPIASAPEPVVIEEPVFVVSAPRAGSSLLFETLTAAPGLVTIGGESHALIESIDGLHPRARGWDSNRLDPTQATGDTVAGLHRAFAAELRDRDGRAAAGRVRMLEKTPKNALRVPFLAAAFPDARFVYLYRDPRETISSMLDAWRSGRFVTYPELPGWGQPPWSLLLVPGWRDLVGTPLARIVTTQWATTTTMLLDDLEAIEPDRWCVVSYDRLVSDPAAALNRVCEFLDLDWDVDRTGPLPLSRHTLDSPHPEKWRRNADELRAEWERIRPVARRAHAAFAEPPRMKPVRPSHPSTTAAPSSRAAAVADETAPFRSVHSDRLVPVLDEIDASLLVSTYQSGRVIIVRCDGDRLNTHFRGFPSPMGMARQGPQLAIGTHTGVTTFQDQPAISGRLDPPGRHDACFVPRRVHTTGDIRVHDLAYAGDELWVVNTRFSCLAGLDDTFSFVPRWRPPFVSALAPDDRCHLNGVAVDRAGPRYVTVLGRTDTPSGWRADKAHGGALLDVGSGEPVVTGMCMPHSPRWHDGRLWVLESGLGTLGVVDVNAGTVEEVARLPGFTRGLGFAGRYALVGLSQVREDVFDGLPIAATRDERLCGVWAVDLTSGHVEGFIRFEDAVQEIFEVTVLDGLRFPEVVEPDAELVASTFMLPDTALADVPPELRS